MVHPDYRKGDKGDLLLEHIEQKAQQLGMEKLFDEPQTAGLSRGFSPAGLANVPENSTYNRPEFKVL